MNLNEIRTFVRTQLDLDETDLPDVLLNVYIQDGYDHIIALENRWPFFEVLWRLTIPTTGQLALGTDVATIESLVASDGHRLVRVDTRWIEDTFAPNTTNGTSVYWTQLGTAIATFPPPATDMDVTARGYRRPANWIAGGASAQVDADPRLHLPICWYACSLGYAQQEDEVLEATYMTRFREAATVAHDSVMRYWSGSPKILNSVPYGRRAFGAAPSLVFQLPPTTPEFDGTIDGGSP